MKMGISNFTKLIECFNGDCEQWNASFDSILIDLQSELYVAIDQCLPVSEDIVRHEKQFFDDVSRFVQKRLAEIILDLFKNYSKQSEEEVVVVCSFDGHGVPMKWPTQRNRRVANHRDPSIAGKNLYRVSLFGDNVLSAKVRDDLATCFRSGRFHDRYFRLQKSIRFPKYMRYIVSGCDVDGEGEHKIFHIAENLGLRYPVFVSMDNDAFVLSFARMDRYECVQLRNKHKLYNLTNFVQDVLTFPVHIIVYVSLLFGNDFVPPVMSITENNCYAIKNGLASVWEAMLDNDEASVDQKETVSWLPVLYFRFIEEMKPHLRYDKESNRTLIEIETIGNRFWLMCLWTIDYYKKREFPQKFMKNEIFDEFDRNALLVALTDLEFSKETFEKALKSYQANDIPKEEEKALYVAAERVFDPESLGVISRFLIEKRNDEEQGDEAKEGCCCDIKISTLKRKLREPNEV